MNILLIDSNFLCYRAFYSVGNLEYNGISTGITYGFLNQFFNIVKEIQPDRIIFFWDSKKSKRREILPTYKQKGEKTEEEKEILNSAFKQFKKIRMSILPQIGFTNNFMQIGYESDDLIAQYIHSDYTENSIFTATSDDDLLQLINERSIIYNLNKNMYYDKQLFIDKWGINPCDWKNVKCIAGCSTDNVPGVPNVREKTAVKYLKGELKSTYKTFQAIEDNKGLIKFNEKLVVLPFEGTIDFHNEVKEQKFSMKDFLNVCRKYGFNSFRTDKKKEEIRALLS